MSRPSPYELLAGLALLRERKRQLESAGQGRLETWSVLVVKMAGELYAVHQDDVDEILAQDKLTPLTGVEPWLVGMACFRGKLLNVIHLGLLSDDLMDDVDSSVLSTGRVLVTQGYREWFGVCIDELVGIRHVWSDSVVQQDGDTKKGRKCFWGYAAEHITIENNVIPVLQLKPLIKALEKQDHPKPK